jgi:hypothetical protein
MFFSRISDFGDFHANLVAVTRHPCRVLATVGLIALAGCAGTPAPTPSAGSAQSAPAPATPQARQALVTQRATARWEALVKDDLDTAYGYFSPGSKQLISLEKFKANTRRGAFRDGKVESVTCEDDACQVKLTVTYDHPKMKGITTPVVESWIVDGGQAWLVSGTR